MKKTSAIVSINLEIDGNSTTLQFFPEQLRAWINNLKITPDQKTVTFEFEYEGKKHTQNIGINTGLATIKSAVKYAELLSNIIPLSLSKYLIDITQKIAQRGDSFPQVINREHEIEKSWFYLSPKTRNNVFFVGNKDVGKTALANELARRISTNNCPAEFYNKRILMLKPQLLLGIKNEFIYKHKLIQILDFLISQKDDVILFVDKAILLKTDFYLIYLLYDCLNKHHIPFISTSSPENFEDYFYNDTNISKYINYIIVEEPELEDVEAMIQPKIQKLQKQYGITISDKMIKYAIYTSSLSGYVSCNPGRVINILERAFVESNRRNHEEVDKQSILNCYDTRINEYLKMPEDEKRATAYHETGHYILAVKCTHRKNLKISCVSNLPMNWWAGVTMSYIDSKKYAVYSKEYFLDYIAMCLAGRIAEKKFTNLNSTGASTDLEYASSIAKAMIMEWGFSENSSNINRHYEPIDYYLMPECKKKAIDDEVQSLVDEGTKRASEILEENKELLKIIAEKLYTEEILTGEQLEAICNDYEQNGKSE